MYRRGFTIVELIITITIMGILLVLGVVNLRGTQANARDDERKTDIEAIAVQLESYYTSGNDASTTFGRYPSTGIIGNERVTLRDIDPKSLATPGAPVDANNIPISSLVAATGVAQIQTTAGVTPQPTINTYVYQPVQADGTLCTTGAQECRKFNLYYMLETDSTVYMVTSKNQ
jgi:prepilin-type N-terminal cleavage/methylation domain-containing protein